MMFIFVLVQDFSWPLFTIYDVFHSHVLHFQAFVSVHSASIFQFLGKKVVDFSYDEYFYSDPSLFSYEVVLHCSKKLLRFFY